MPGPTADDRAISRAVVPARAALAGNPSDLYRGAVLAVPVRAFTAAVEFSPGPETVVEGEAGAAFLVRAALRRAAGAGAGPTGRVRWRTDIPRAVGLAGSSALVVATLRASNGGQPDPLALAVLAQQVENDDLGIVAGLQDRVVQAYDRPVLVDLAGAEPAVTVLDPPAPVRLLVAWSPAAAAGSGKYHRALARRLDRDRPRHMEALALHARAAADALAAGDEQALADAMAASARTRNRAAPLGPAHQELAGAVEGAGLRPNSAGSGGSVVAVLPDGADLDRVAAAVAGVRGEWLIETISPGRSAGPAGGADPS